LAVAPLLFVFRRAPRGAAVPEETVSE
jgi:hypothetical protein